MVPVVAIAGVAASSRGLTGEISHVWTELTSPTAPQPGNNPGRIAELGNSRPLYWSEGLKVGEHAVLAGVGAGGFDTARTRYSSSTLAVAHAHSYVIETFADFGLIGIAVSLALLVAWALAVARTLGIRARPRAGRHRRERRRPPTNGAAHRERRRRARERERARERPRPLGPHRTSHPRDRHDRRPTQRPPTPPSAPGSSPCSRSS